MADQPDAPGTAPVTDRRPVPRGVLPRGVQTWLMAALAIGMLLIIFLTGQPDGARHRAAPPAVATQAADPDRVRDYQERLRALDAQAALDAKAAASSEKALPPSFDNDAQAASAVRPGRRRPTASRLREPVREQRRPEPSARNARTAARSPRPSRNATPQGRPEPSIDDIADAVVRATSRGPER